MKNDETLVATYHFNGRAIDVYGFNKEGENRFENYDLYENGDCLNEGDVFYTLPSFKSVIKYLKKNKS